MKVWEEGSRLTLRPLSSLLPHEETVPGQARNLASQMKRDRFQIDPIVVDSESGTVLDGMHRLEAMKSLGLEHAVCYSVDYSSSTISLHRWVRAIRAAGEDRLLHLLRALGIKRKVSFEEAFSLAEGRPASLAILGEDFGYAVTGNSLQEMFQIVRKIDSVARTLGWDERFVPEDEIDIALSEGRVAVVLPRITKHDVVQAAITRNLLPSKTTMHVIDPRPVRIEFPLEELKKREPPIPLLKKRVESASVEVLPPGSIYEGRRYKERLILLSSG